MSLYLKESTTPAARSAFGSLTVPLPIIPLGILEVRNALNLAIVRGRINSADRDTQWATFEFHRSIGLIEERFIDSKTLHAKALELSDRHTPVIASRSLDLLHVAAALLLGASELLTFDQRQGRVALAEGLAVRP